MRCHRRRVLMQRLSRRRRVKKAAIVPKPLVLPPLGHEDPIARLPGPARLLIKEFVTGWQPTPSAQVINAYFKSPAHAWVRCVRGCLYKYTGCPCHYFKVIRGGYREAQEWNALAHIFWM